MIERKRGLGRGLDALIPLPGDRRESSVPQLVPIDQVQASDQQVRRTFDPDRLRELAESIREHGLLQPILVRRTLNGFQLIAGERRWRAARLAGLARLPALVRDAEDPQTRLLLGLIENLQREGLNPIEEAHGIRLLMDRHGLTQEEVATRLNKNRVSIAHALKLLQAAPAVQAAAATGTISPGHARALAGLPTPEAQELGLKVVVGRRLSVRQAEGWVKQYSPRPLRRRLMVVGDGLGELAEELSLTLGAVVQVRGDGERGTVEIRYRSAAELQAIAAKLRA